MTSKRRQDPFDQLRKKYPALSTLVTSELAHHKAWSDFGYLTTFVTHLYDWLELTLRSVDNAGRKVNKSDPADDLAVYGENAIRWCSLQWAVLSALQRGGHGECYAIGRMLLEQTDLLTLLASEPESIPDWLESTGTFGKSPPRGWQPQGIRERLDRIDARSYPSELYSQTSTAIHPSHWGNTLYSARVPGQNTNFVLTPTAQFDPVRALDILGLSFRITPLAVWQFMRIAERRNLPRKVQQSFKDRYADLMVVWELMLEYRSKLLLVVQEFEQGRDSENPGWVTKFADRVDSVQVEVFGQSLSRE